VALNRMPLTLVIPASPPRGRVHSANKSAILQYAIALLTAGAQISYSKYYTFLLPPGEGQDEGINPLHLIDCPLALALS